MFKYHLSRLPYAVLVYAHQFWAIAMIGTGKPVDMAIVIASLPVVLILAILPRVRDCDWPQWVGVLAMVPYLGILTGTALLFAPSKVFGRRDEFHNSERSDANGEHRLEKPQVAGSLCDTCGIKILLATDGGAVGDLVLCNECQKQSQPDNAS